VTHLTTPDKPVLSVLMKLTDDHEDRPSRAVTKKHRAAESVLRRLLGSFLIPRLGGPHHPTTNQSEIGRSEKAALSGVGRASMDDALRRVGNILELAHSRTLRAGRMAHDRCRLLKVRMATIIPGLAYNSQNGFQVRDSIQLNT
jgi:hypothetical protein